MSIVGSNFKEAKIEFLKFVHDRYDDGGDNGREYELRRKEGLYVVFIIGNFNDTEFYYDKGYMYGRTGWKYVSDMGNLVEHRDKLEKVIRFTFEDYEKVDQKNINLFHDINEQSRYDFRDPKEVEEEMRDVKKSFISIIFNQFKDVSLNNRDVTYELRHMGIFGRDLYICHMILPNNKYGDIGFSYDLGNEEWNISKNLTGLERQGESIMKINYDDYLKTTNTQNKLFNNINESKDHNMIKKSFIQFILNEEGFAKFVEEVVLSDEHLTTDPYAICYLYDLSSKEELKYNYFIKAISNDGLYDHERYSVYDEKTNEWFKYRDATIDMIEDIELIQDWEGYDPLHETEEPLLRFDNTDYEKMLNNKEKLFNNINERKLSNETLLDWISMKLQHTIGERIGRGMEGVIHRYSKGKVIKITTEDAVQQYNLLNKNIRGIAKIYHTGLIEVPKRFFKKGEDGEVSIGGESKVKGFNDFRNTKHKIDVYTKYIGYIIMEEVDTSIGEKLSSEMNELADLLTKEDENGIIYLDKFPEDLKEVVKRNYTSDFQSIQHHDIFNIFNLLSKRNPNSLKKELDKYFELDPIIYELIDVLYNIGKHYVWEDVHSGQFGLNSKGELVAFDIADDDEKFGQSLGYYPTPKNIIKESKSNLPIEVKKSFLNFIETTFKRQNINIERSDDNEIVDNNCWLMYIDDLFPNDEKQYIIKHKRTLSEPDGFDNTDITEYYFYDGKNGFIEAEVWNGNYWRDMEEYDRYSAPMEQNYDVLMEYSYDNYKDLKKQHRKLFNDINESNNNLSKVKKCYINFVRNEKDFNKKNYDFLYNISDVAVYESSMRLLDFTDSIFDDDINKNIVDFKYSPYIIKVKYLDENEVYANYYMYDELNDEFVSAYDIMMSSRNEDLDGYLVNADHFSNTIENHTEVVMSYNYKDWLDNHKKSLDAVKTFNERVLNFNQFKSL